jgi:4-hydroxy-tetrahydrodipicolinate synthase
LVGLARRTAGSSRHTNSPHPSSREGHNNRIYPLACVFYANPWADMHNRMKEALVLLGRLPRAVVRPPLVKLAGAEIDRIHVALVKAGLLSAKTARDAA